jgi:hypothetical protein
MMGCLYRPGYTGRDKTTNVATLWWLQYRDASGKLVCEASGTVNLAES